jgi:hypothetical protein
MKCPVNSDLVYNSDDSLSTTAYFMLINLFNSDLAMRAYVPHGADGVIARLSQIDDAKRPLSKEVLKLIERVNACPNYVATDGLLPSCVLFLVCCNELDSILSIVLRYLE